MIYYYLTEITDACSFADYTTLFAYDSDLKHFMKRLKHDDAKLAIEWFKNNYMKLNEDECQILVVGHRYFGNLGEKQKKRWQKTVSFV